MRALQAPALPLGYGASGRQLWGMAPCLSTVPPPPIGDVDLVQAKARVGDRICLNGNVDIINVIKDGSPEQVRQAVRQAILDAARGGGFILGTSDSIREAPLENVRAYFEAGRRYGNYAHLGAG